MTTPAPELFLSEQCGAVALGHSAPVQYRTDWYCEPPPRGVPFQVLRDEWSNDTREIVPSVRWVGGKVRSIYEIRITVQPGELFVRTDHDLWLT